MIGFVGKLLGWLVWVPFLLGLVGGCNVTKDQAESLKEALKPISEFARENDMALVVTINFNGDPNFYAKQSFGFDTGLSATATLQANAGDEDDASETVSRPDVPPVPPVPPNTEDGT